MKDPKSHHDFISTGVVDDDNRVIVYYAGNFSNVSKQYGTVATLKFNFEEQAKEYKEKQDALFKKSTEPKPIVFRSKANTTLHDVLFGESEYGDDSEKFDCYVGLPTDQSKPFMSANMKVFDVPQFEHFDDEEYPEFGSFFMYIWQWEKCVSVSHTHKEARLSPGTQFWSSKRILTVKCSIT